MSESKIKRNKQDDYRVDSNDPDDVKHLHLNFPQRSRAEIVAAIQEAGPYRKDIIRHLQIKRWQ